MPMYEYHCPKCEHVVEVLQRHDEPGPKRCPNCGGRKMARVMSNTSFEPSARDGTKLITLLHLAGVKALEIEQDNQTFRLVSADEELGSARIIFGGSFDPPHRGQNRALLDCLLTRFPKRRSRSSPCTITPSGKTHPIFVEICGVKRWRPTFPSGLK